MSRAILAFFSLLLALGPPALARDGQEPNNAFEQATKVASGKTLQASIHPVKDVDFFAVDVPAPGVGYLDVTVRDVPAEIAPLVQVFGPDRKEIGKAQRPVGNPLFHRTLLKAAGKHYVSLRDGQGGWQDKLDDKASAQAMQVTIRYTAVSQAFEPNNELKQAAAVPLGKAVEASLFPRDDQDYYKIAIPEPGHGILAIRLSKLPQGLNPGIWIVDGEDKSTQMQWSRQTQRETVLIHHAKAPGEVTFLVSTQGPKSRSGYYGYSRRKESPSPYILTVDFIPSRDAFEPNDDAKTAKPLAFGEAKSAVLFPKGDHDFYKLAIPKPGRGRLDVTVRGLADAIAPRLTLFGPDGKEVEQTARPHGSEVHYARDLAAAGAYVLRLQDAYHSRDGYSDGNDDAYARRPYTIRAAFTPAPDAHEPNDTHDTAKAVAINQPVEAAIFPARDGDFYKATIPPKTRGMARIRVAGLPDRMRPLIRIFDAAKRQLQQAQGTRGQDLVLTRALVAGDYFVEVRDYDSSAASLEPYTLTIGFEPVPATAGEPNDKLEQAEPIQLGQARQATLFPAGDGDVYKIELAEAGPIRVQAGDFAEDVYPRINLYGPDKKHLLRMDRHTSRIQLDVTLAKPGVHYIQVHPLDLNQRGHWIPGRDQFDVVPYTILVTRPPAAPPQGVAEREPNEGTFEAQPIQAGQTVLAKIDKPRDRDWFRLPVPGPAHVDIGLPHVPPDLDLHLNAYYLPAGAPQQPTRHVLYLTGHAHYNLHEHHPDVRFTAHPCASAEAKAAFANPALMRRYQAIVVDVLHDPTHLDLASPRVQANITSYVQAGGVFLVLAPVCPLKLFGIEVAEANRWHEDVVVDLGIEHPLLPPIAERKVRGWDVVESSGYFKGWREAGFTLLFAHASDPEQHAATAAKQMGRGWLIFDAQTIGHHRNWPEADWKFRSYLGLPKLAHLGYFNDTRRHASARGEGSPEFARLRVWKPGTVFINVWDGNDRRQSAKPYALSAAVTPITAPPPAESALLTAKPLTVGPNGEAEATMTLSGVRQQGWYRVDGRASGELSAELSGVAPNVDAQLTIVEGRGGKPRKVLYLHGERGDFHLDLGFPDIEFERIEWNDPRALGVLLRLDAIKGYHAVVVDAVTRPNEFGLASATVARNVEAYAQQGGRFIVLSPLCQLKVFGVENVDWGTWHQDNALPTYPTHPLLAARTRDDRFHGWPSAEAVGYWLHDPKSGFQPVLAEWRDLHRHAVTLARQVGQGWIILDAQPLGQRDNLAAAAWKLYAYLGVQPTLRRVGVYNGTQAAGLGAGEHCRIETQAVPYYIQVANLLPTTTLRPMRLRVRLTSAERPLEPDDTPVAAKAVATGQEAQANLLPSGDEDWRAVSAPGRGLLSLRLTGVPDNLDPVVEVRRPQAGGGKALRVLYLEGDPANELDAARFVGVTVTRIDAFEARAATALEELAKHDVAILSALSDARQFGMHRRESHAKLQRFVEGGGRCIVLRPHGLSFAENCPQMGGVLVAASSQHDVHGWHAAHASDGYKVPGQHGRGWCCGRGAKVPHTLTWSFGGQSRRLDRLVLYNHTSSTGARAKEIEVLVGDSPEALRSIGKFVAADGDERQVFRFAAAACKAVQLKIASNYGHKTETQVGEVEFYGPESLVAFFGVPLEGGWPSGSTVAADPLHWVLNRRRPAKLTGWGGAECAGLWSGWREAGFQLVCADRSDPRARAITLVKRVGKGWVVLDSQSLTHPPFADHAAAKLENLLDVASTAVGRFDQTQARRDGGAETLDLPVTAKGAYLVRVADSVASDQVANRSPRRYAFAAAFRPEDSEFEPNDTALRQAQGAVSLSNGAARAIRLSSDEAVEEALFPGGDVDWYQLAVEQPSLATVLLDDVPTSLDPVIEVYRVDLAAKPVKVLYLACRANAQIDRRTWGPAPVAFTCIEAGSPAEATAMDKLAGFDAVLLDGLDDARRFGMNRKETWQKIERYAEGGGRFVMLGPLGYSFSLLAKESGASLVDWSKASAYGGETVMQLCDGIAQPRSSGGSWSSRSRAKPPHWFVFRLAGTEPVSLDRLVVYNTTYYAKRCAKEIELQVATAAGADFKSVGKWECKAVDGRQAFTFQPVAARHVKILVHSNHGDASYTTLGEVELYGPGQPEAPFGVHHARGHVDVQAVAADANHWIVASRAKGEANGWSGYEATGYFTEWEQSGFGLVYGIQPPKPQGDAPAPRITQAVTLCRKVGKGFIVLDAQDLGAPGREQVVDWKLRNYLGVAPTRVAAFNNTQNVDKGGREHFAFAAEPGLYTLRVTDAQFEQRRAQGRPEPEKGAPWSLDKMRLLVSVEPLDAPFEPNGTPEQATWLASGQAVRSTIQPEGDVDWFRLSLAKATPVTLELVDVPADLDPMIEVFAAGKLEQRLRTLSSSQGGTDGCPEMAVWKPNAPGDYTLKVTATRYTGAVANAKAFTLRALFDDAKKPVPPKIVSAWPPAGLRSASLAPDVVVQFDQPMSPRAMGSGAITVRGSKSGTMRGKVTYDPARYRATFSPEGGFGASETVTVSVPSGLAGLHGGKLAQGREWSFTTMSLRAGGKPATVRIALAAGSTVGVGEATVTLKPSRKLRGTPSLVARVGGTAISVAGLRQAERGQWAGKLAIRPNTPNGPATFEFKGIDSRGLPVAEITEGKTFVVDTKPPPAMAGLAAAPAAGGKARLTWKRPAGIADLGGYRLYRSERDANRVEGATAVKTVAGADFLTWDDPTPKDGTWFYFLAAVDHAGNVGPPSPTARVATDRVGPKQAIAGVTAKVVEKPRVDLAWKATAEADAVGYSVFRFVKKAGEALPSLADAEPLTEVPRDRLTLEDFPKDAAYLYVVAARDAAGNLSPASTPAEVVVDTRRPDASITLSSKTPLTQGTHTMAVTLNEPLGGDLELAVKLPGNVVRKLEPKKKDGLTYEATLALAETDSDGWAYIQINGVDRYGNTGIRIVRTSGFRIDVGPPRAHVYTTPAGRLPAGKIPVRVEFLEAVKDGAKLWCTVGEQRVDVPLKRQDSDTFTGELVLKPDLPNGKAEFHVEATDNYQHTGGAVVRGKEFVIDTRPPEPPLGVAVKPGRGRSLVVTWSAPTAEPIAHFKLYGSTDQAFTPGKETLLGERVRGTEASHKPKENEILWFAVTAVDRAGNESAPSKVVKGVPDVTPPPPATDLRVVLGGDKRLRLTWTAPQADEPVSYNVYRLAAVRQAHGALSLPKGEGAASIAGLKPVAQTQDTTALDDPKKDGVYRYLVTAVDEAGNESPAVAAQPFDYDVNPPTATVALTPTEGTRGYRESYYVHYTIGVLAAGEKTLTLTPSEPLAEPPVLRYRMLSMDTPKAIALTEADGKWQGRIAIPEKTDDGKLFFFFQGVDRKGNRGDEIPRGQGNLLWIDTTPPEVVAPLKVVSRPVGKIELDWSPPPGEGYWEVTYSVYRSTEAFKLIGGLKPIKAGLEKPGLTDEPPKDGTYHYAVVAVDWAGNMGKLHESTAAVSDGTPPAAPTAVKATVKGEIHLTWQAPADEKLEFRVLRGGDVVADHLTPRAFTDAPDDDGTVEYRVVATDAAGNVSQESEPAKVEFVNTLPVATLVTEPASPVRSTFRVAVASSQPLKGVPDLFLHLAHGKPLRVPVEAKDGKFIGSVQVTKDMPNGEAKFTFQGVSQAGHTGTRIRSGEAIAIDTAAPAAGLVLSPPSPLKAGKVQLTLRPSEPLKDTPKLSYTPMGANAREIALTKGEKGYTAEIEITPQDQDGVGFFTYSGIDMAGNVGSRLHGARFVVDSHPPKPPTGLAAKPKAQGYVELGWKSPVYTATDTPDQIVGYNVYAAAQDFTEIGDLQPLRRATRNPVDVRAPADGTFFFAVTAVDATGHESAPSKTAKCVVRRTAPAPPRIARAQASPAAIDIAWEAADDAVAFSVFVHVPGEERSRRVAEKIKERSFTYRPLHGGRYVVRVQAFDAFDQASHLSPPAVVEFEQNAPLARIAWPGDALGYGAVPLAVETTRPLLRAPKLRLVPDAGDPIDVPLQGAGQSWRGALTLDKDVRGKTARFEYEGVAGVAGREVTGRGILAGDAVTLDFVPPTAAVHFAERVPTRDRKVIVKAGRQRFFLRASEPLKETPKLTFTPRGKATQTLELLKRSDTEWGAILVVDPEVGDGAGIFELDAVDPQGNRGDAITANRNVDIDTTPPSKIRKIRAVPLPRGKVRVDWIPPYFEDGSVDKEANTFQLYRAESEITDITGLEPRVTVQRVLGFVDRPPSDRDYFYAVAAVDDAGNLGAVSASAKVHVDKNAPGKPVDFRVKQLDTGVVHLSWKPPEGEKPLFYNVYLAKHPILTTQGMTPRNPGVTWTQIYGAPNENGIYYFAVTAVDPALNEGEPCESVKLDYKTIAPVARFFLEPDIWLHNGDYTVTLRTSKPLVEPPQVVINSEHDKKYPIAFEGSGDEWRATLKIDDAYPEGTYGFIYRGKDAEGNTGDEIQRGPLFHVDKTAPLSPGELKIKPDDRGTPGAVVLEWVTPKKKDAQTEVPHFYNIYRSEKDITSIEGLTSIHTYKVVYENLDNYKYTDMPPANGAYYYVVTSLDMARNESKPSNVFKVTVQSDSPRATLDFYAVVEGKASPAPTTREGTPIIGKGNVRVVLTTTSPLDAAPKLAWHLHREEDKKHPITLTGKDTKWEGEFQIEGEFDILKTAVFTYEGTSVGGAKGTFIRKGGTVKIDTEGPEAEIIIPDAYKMLVNVKTNKLEAPPTHGGRVLVKLTTKEELAQPPKLTYTLDDGDKTPIPLTGFGAAWGGWMDIPHSEKAQDGKFEYEGVDRAGNVSAKIAKRRYPYDADDNFPPRKIASYATTGGVFRTDTVAPEAPTDVETEMRKLGVAVVKWKEPPGQPWTYNLYRSLTPISQSDNLKPIKTGIYAPIMVDAPPVDGNYFYSVTAVDMAGNESGISESKSVFIDTIKPELKIKAAPSGDDFVILVDENAPPELSLTINFPGQKSIKVELGGSSGELKEYQVRTMPNGQRGIVLPQKAEFFNGRVEVIVHSPDPEGNVVEEKTEVEFKQISTATGGAVESVDQQVQLVIPPGMEPVIPKGPNDRPRVGGYENLFFIQYANIPDKKPTIEPGRKRRRDEVDPVRPGLEVVGVPYRIEMNQPPEEPLELSASPSQVDFSQLTKLTAKLKMKIPTQYSDAVEDPDYLKSRLQVRKWVAARSDDEEGRWEPVPDIEVDVKNKTLIVPATDITTYIIVAERTPPSIRDLKPERGNAVTTLRPEISCLIVDKGTGVAIGAENDIALFIDGKRKTGPGLSISKGNPTEVRVTYTPQEDLTPGPHVVTLRAQDVVENTANVKWQFTVDNQPPEFLAVAPKEGARLPVARPVIQARIRDEGGIDPRRTQLAIDGSRVASVQLAWDEAAGLLTCTLRDELPSGTHRAVLTVRDKGGTEAKHEWSFRTDLEAPAVARILPAPDTAVATDTQAVGLRIQDLFGRAKVLSVRIDGVRIPLAQKEGDDGYAFDPEKGDLTYKAPKPFAVADHEVSVVFSDDLGNSATRSWRFRSKEGSPAATAWAEAIRTPKFETVRTSYEAVAERVDVERLERYAPKAAPVVTKLVEEAEELEVARKFDESAAKYTEAETKLATVEKQVVAAEEKAEAEAATAAVEAAKKAHADLAETLDLDLLRKHAPETMPQVEKLTKEGDALAAEGKLDEAVARYEQATARLDAARRDTTEVARAAELKAAKAKLAGAREKYSDLLAKANRERIEKHVPDALPAAAKLAREAEDLAAEEKLLESAAKFTAAAETLGQAETRAEGLAKAAAAAALAAEHGAAKKRYAEVAGRVDRQLIGKHVAEALPAAEKLARDAGTLAGEQKLAESAAKFREAADRLLAADTKAERLAREAKFGAVAKLHEAAKRKYSELAARVNTSRIERHVAGTMAAVRQLVRDAETLEAHEQLAESAQKYEQAATTLAAAETRAEGAARATDTAARTRYEVAKKRCTGLAQQVDQARIRKHVPDAMAEVSRLLQQAMSLAADGKLAESAATYEATAQKLAAADAKARQLEQAATPQPDPKLYRAARKRLAELAAKLDMARIEKLVPGTLSAVTKLVQQAAALSDAGKVVESAAKYNEAHARLVAAERTARERESGTVVTPDAAEQLRAARAAYAKALGAANTTRIAKHLPAELSALKRLVSEAEALAQHNQPGEATAKYAEATKALASAEAKAEAMDRAPAVDVAEARRRYEAARERYVEATRQVDAGLIAKRLPAVFPAVKRLLDEAGQLARAGDLTDGASTLDQATALLADADRRVKGATPTADPVTAEMTAIDALLTAGRMQEAVGRVADSLVKLWTKHRRTQWADLLAWVQQRRRAYPRFAEAGRNRLPVVERQLADYANQEREWATVANTVGRTADLDLRIRLVETYIRGNYRSLYLTDARDLLHKLQVEKLRRSEGRK